PDWSVASWSAYGTGLLGLMQSTGSQETSFYFGDQGANYLDLGAPFGLVRSSIKGSACSPAGVPIYFKKGDVTNYCDAHHFWSHHTGGACFAFGDGSVRFLSYSAYLVLIPLSTRSAGDMADPSSY